MQPGEKKKLMLLAALFGVVAAVWGYRFLADGRGDNGAVGDVRAKQPAAVLPMEPVLVDLEALHKERPAYEPGRNIFNPTYREPVVAPPAAAKKAEAVPAVPPPPPPPPKDTDGDGVPDNADDCPDTPPGVRVDGTGCPPEVTAARKATEQMKKFKFVGFIKRSGRTDIFLAFENAYFVASKGEDIAQTFYLKDIGESYLLIGDRVTTAEFRMPVNFKEGEMDAKSVPLPGASGAGAAPAPAPSPARGRTSPQQPVRPVAPVRPGVSEVFPGADAQDGEEEDDYYDEYDEEDFGDEEGFPQGGQGGTKPPANINRSIWVQ